MLLLLSHFGDNQGIITSSNDRPALAVQLHICAESIPSQTASADGLVWRLRAATSIGGEANPIKGDDHYLPGGALPIVLAGGHAQCPALTPQLWRPFRHVQQQREITESLRATY